MRILAISFLKISQFKKDENGGATMQAAMLFGAVSLALALLVTPQLKKAGDYYAQNKKLGIDSVTTAGIDESSGTKTYVIRKSVLDK